MPTLLLFDIDGTILRMKGGSAKKLFQAFIKEYTGRDLPEGAALNFAGMTDINILRQVADAIGIPFYEMENDLPDVWQKLAEYFKPYCTPEYIYMLPGVVRLIEMLHKSNDFQLALLTGNFRENAYMKLKTFDLDKYFPFGAFGCDLEDRNLLPDIAINRANSHDGAVFSRSNTIIIGDSPRDVECGKSNSIPVLAVATGDFSMDDLAKLNPEALLPDFSDLKKTMETLENLTNNNEYLKTLKMIS